MDFDLKRNLVGLAVFVSSAPSTWGPSDWDSALSSLCTCCLFGSDEGALDGDRGRLGEADFLFSSAYHDSGFIELRIRRRLGEGGASVIVAQPCFAA